MISGKGKRVSPRSEEDIDLEVSKIGGTDNNEAVNLIDRVEAAFEEVVEDEAKQRG